MTEIALAAMLFFVVAVLVAMRRQQQTIDRLYQSQPPIIQTRTQPQPQHKLSESEKRIILLMDDADTLLRQILTRKVHSRAHCTRNLGFSEYRWNKAMRLLRHLDIYDDYRRHLNCSYREARQRIRKHMQNQIALGRASDRFVPSV